MANLTKIKHTDGPWELDKDGHVKVKYSPVYSLQLIKIRSPWREEAYDDDKEALANMKLIAAAPELLQALKEAKKLIGQFRLKKQPTTQDEWEKICAAIKKAE